MTTAFITHGDYLKHVMGPDHPPECPERLGAITQYLASTELGDRIKWLAAQSASDKVLEKVHPVEYIRWLDSLQPETGLVYADPDTALNPHTMHAARLAAGGGNHGNGHGARQQDHQCLLCRTAARAPC